MKVSDLPLRMSYVSFDESVWDTMSEEARKELVERATRLENMYAVEWPIMKGQAKVSRTEFTLERAKHAGDQWMVHAVRYVELAIVAESWVELHRLQPYSPTGIHAIMALLRDKARSKTLQA